MVSISVLQYVYPTSFGTFTSLTNATWLNSFQIVQRGSCRNTELAGVTTDPWCVER